MIAVKTYSSNSEAERAVLMLKRAGVSGFAKTVTGDKNADFPYGTGIQVHVVEDAARKAHQVLDVFG